MPGRMGFLVFLLCQMPGLVFFFKKKEKNLLPSTYKVERWFETLCSVWIRILGGRNMYIDSQCAGGVLWMRRAVSYVVCTCMYVPVGEDFSPFVCMNDIMHLFLFHPWQHMHM